MIRLYLQCLILCHKFRKSNYDVQRIIHLTAKGNSLNDIITVNSGNDSLICGTGNDTYIFNSNWGQDIIQDNTGTNNIIEFNANISKNDLSFQSKW